MHTARHLHVHIHVRHSERIGRLWKEREPGTKWKAADGLAEDISRTFIQSTNQNVQWC
jgi:diadenosine tetraphosphate (Ap4A) HIT family hydrolase